MLNAAEIPTAVKVKFKKPGNGRGTNPRLPYATRRSRLMRVGVILPIDYPCEFLDVWWPLVHSTFVPVRF